MKKKPMGVLLGTGETIQKKSERLDQELRDMILTEAIQTGNFKTVDKIEKLDQLHAEMDKVLSE